MLHSQVKFVVIWCLLAVPALGQAQVEFSAVMVQNHQGSSTRERVFSGKKKMRIEPDASASNAPIVLLDFNRGSSVLLLPYQKAFIEITGIAGDAKGRMVFLTPVDPQHPCNSLVAEPGSAAVPCQNSGPAELNGRKVTKWTGKLAGGQEGYVWIDSKLNLIIRLEASGNMVELQDIQEKVQDPTLFDVPDGYSRVRLGPQTADKK